MVVLALTVLRKMAGLTQGELAKKLRASQASLSQWESGSYAIPDDQAEEILKALRSRLRKRIGFSPAQMHVITNLKAADLSLPWDALLVDAAITLRKEVS